MKVVKSLFISVIILLAMTACEHKLSENERSVMANDLPKELFKEKVGAVGLQLGEYLTDAVSEYSESLRNNLQKEIDERNAADALWGGGNAFDVYELFGTSTNEMIAKTYNKYINYVNGHIDEISEMSSEMIQVLGEHPEFIDKFKNESQETISLEIFKGIKNVPISISGSSLDFGMLTLDETDKYDWGEILMGKYNKPQISVPAILYASILAVEYLEKPKLVYVIYDEDTDSWDAGYDSEQALNVVFKTKGDILQYEYAPTQYNKEFIESKLNVISENK